MDGGGDVEKRLVGQRQAVPQAKAKTDMLPILSKAGCWSRSVTFDLKNFAILLNLLIPLLLSLTCTLKVTESLAKFQNPEK